MLRATRPKHPTLSITILVLLGSLVPPIAAHADQEARREQIFEQARIGRGLWQDFQDRIAGIQSRTGRERPDVIT